MKWRSYINMRLMITYNIILRENMLNINADDTSLIAGSKKKIEYLRRSNKKKNYILKYLVYL